MGGMHGFGAVVEPGGELAYHERWEPRVFAIQMLVGVEGLGAGPGGRAVREEMDPARYLAASYYERWLYSAEQRLLRKGTIAPGDVEAMMERLRPARRCRSISDAAMAERMLEDLRTRDADGPAARGGSLRRLAGACASSGCTRPVIHAARATSVGRSALSRLCAAPTACPIARSYGEKVDARAGVFGRLQLGGALGAERRARLEGVSRSLGQLSGAGVSDEPRPSPSPAGLGRSSCAPAPSRRCWPSAGSSLPTRSTPWSSCTRTTSDRRTAPRSSLTHGWTRRIGSGC